MIKENLNANRPQKIFTSWMTDGFWLPSSLQTWLLSQHYFNVISLHRSDFSSTQADKRPQKPRTTQEVRKLCFSTYLSSFGSENHFIVLPVHPTAFQDPDQRSWTPWVRPFNSYIQQVDYLFYKCCAKAAFDSSVRKIKHPFTTGDGFW